MIAGFIIAIVIIQSLLLFLHYAVYAVLAAVFGIGSPALFWTAIGLSLTFVAASVLTFRYSNRAVSWFYTFSAWWLSFAYVLFLASLAFFVAELFIAFGWASISLKLAASIIFGAAPFVFAYGMWNSGRLLITRITVELPNMPQAWKGKKLVFVSDLHLGAVRGARFAAKVAERANAIAPEAVLIGGDLYDGVKCDPDAIIEPLRAIKAPRGIYFITGNHEEFRDEKFFLDAIRRADIRVLMNEAIDLDGVRIAGVDYRDSHHADRLEAILGALNIKKEVPTILMKHEPDHLEIVERSGVALDLSGHTHRAQTFPFMMITKRLYKGFDYGLKKLGGMQVYTSSGSGTWGPPIRLGTRSEIVEITLG